MNAIQYLKSHICNKKINESKIKMIIYHEMIEFESQNCNENINEYETLKLTFLKF